MNYDWQAGVVLLATIVVLTKIGYFLAFRIPDLQRMRELNREQDQLKRAKEKYPPVIRANNRIGLATNALFFLALAPFVITLEAQPWWRYPLDLFLILMIYDFAYYLTHRFLFHGPILLRVHALHHQARDPTYIDAFYVHPLETFIGIALFMGTVLALGAGIGPFNAFTVVAAYLAFMQLNTINHTKVQLPYFPWRNLSWITAKHAVHHENMQKGNYATITLLYDRLFGTLD
ncbi:MAG: sterol desaturase family protein [Pseudomonadales bacterium]|nr:sterol desaturase family protein [Pseudomonadales bacterium]